MIFFLCIIYIFLINFISGFIFYYDTQLDIFQKKSNLISTSNNSLFVFFPGTSSICDNYTQLLYTINPVLNTLCINYKSDLNSSIKYYQNHSFIDRSNTFEIYLTKVLKKIYRTSNLNYLDSTFNLPNWNKIRASGHSQGAIFPVVWAKKHELERLIMFSGPGCQFGKNFHNWLKPPFLTNIDKIYGIESLQDSILPWKQGNPFFSCKKKDGIHNYLNTIGILDKNIQVINPFNYLIRNKTQILLLNTPFISGDVSHLLTSFNINYSSNFRKNLWLYSIL